MYSLFIRRKSGGKEKLRSWCELEGIISLINHNIGEKYLFRQDILKEWISITTFYSDTSVIDRMPKLRRMIIEEYNDTIRPEYKELTGKVIDKIS